MRQRIYIDTSVIGGCLDVEFAEWSKKLVEEFNAGRAVAIISDIMLDEIDLARQEIKDILKEIPERHKEYVLKDEEAEELAHAYLIEHVVSGRYHEDALHIAIATISKVDVLVSWNFRHIVNLDRIRKFNAVNLKRGYTLLEIRSPREILKNE